MDISSIRPLRLSIYRLACFLQNQHAIGVFGLSSTTTNLCSSATSPHLTHLWYIVNHYHPRIFDPMICLSSTMSRYFLSILNGNHVMSHTVSYYISTHFINSIDSQVFNVLSIRRDPQFRSRRSSFRPHIRLEGTTALDLVPTGTRDLGMATYRRSGWYLSSCYIYDLLQYI